MSGKIHTWDIATIRKSVVIGIVLETILIAPAIPTELFPWGHAGPSTWLGMLGFLFNVPGFYVLGVLTSNQAFQRSFETIFLSVFVIQTLIISSVVFVILRWRKLMKSV